MTDQSVIMSHPLPVETDKKLRILECARRLLVQQGFQDIAMDDVAREAKVAKGTLFLYYKSKDELFTAVYGELVDELGQTFEALLKSDARGLPLLRKTVESVLTYFDANRDFMAHLGSGRFPACGARSFDRLKDKFRENHRRVSRLLALSLPRAGGHEELSYETSALFGLCRAAMMEQLMKDSSEPLVGRTEKVVDFFLKGAARK